MYNRFNSNEKFHPQKRITQTPAPYQVELNSLSQQARKKTPTTPIAPTISRPKENEIDPNSIPLDTPLSLLNMEPPLDKISGSILKFSNEKADPFTDRLAAEISIKKNYWKTKQINRSEQKSGKITKIIHDKVNDMVTKKIFNKKIFLENKRHKT